MFMGDEDIGRQISPSENPQAEHDREVARSVGIHHKGFEGLLSEKRRCGRQLKEQINDTTELGITLL
jgi:hypothetical protein